MESYYDKELVAYLNQNRIDYKSTNDFNSMLEHLMDKFSFKYGKLTLEGVDNGKYIKSDDSRIVKDTVDFVNKFFHEQMCNSKEKVIYIGDDLTESIYEFCFSDLTTLIPYFINNIPQLKNLPVIANVDFGHTTPIVTLPLGGICEVDINKIRVEW